MLEDIITRITEYKEYLSETNDIIAGIPDKLKDIFSFVKEKYT